MRWRWILGAAALAGVAVAGTAIVRERRRIAHLDPEEIRDRLHARLPTADGDGATPASTDAVGDPSADRALAALEDALRNRHWRAADDLTRGIVLGGSNSPAGLPADRLDSLDAALIDRLDRLWSENSGQRFGTTTQLRIIAHASDTSWATIGPQLGWIDDHQGWLRHAELEADIHPVGRFPWTPGWLGSDVAIEPDDALDRLYAGLRARTSTAAEASE